MAECEKAEATRVRERDVRGLPAGPEAVQLMSHSQDEAANH